MFPSPSPAIAELGASITQPWVYIKAYATSEQLRALLPASLADRGPALHDDLRRRARFPAAARVPAGYAAGSRRRGGGHAAAATCACVAPDGTLAASGHVALGERLAIYDRIVTEPAHQRRGLGRAVMHALQALARAHGRHEGVLVATDQGRALYEVARLAPALAVGRRGDPGPRRRGLISAAARCTPARSTSDSIVVTNMMRDARATSRP